VKKTNASHYSPLYADVAFRRLDESDDRTFYSTDRFVDHLDSFAQSTVKALIGELIVEENPVILVEEFFKETGVFEKPVLFISRGKPRPKSDKYAPLGIPSDPVYALYADKKGTALSRKARPDLTVTWGETFANDELKKREKAVHTTLCCPHCGEKLRKWAVPDNPFCQTWDNEFMYICFNDLCPYYVRGWDLMYKQTNKTMSYRWWK
jgi:hypothetical protein